MPCEMANSVSCQGPWRPVELGRLQAAPVQPLCSEGPMGAAGRGPHRLCNSIRVQRVERLTSHGWGVIHPDDAVSAQWDCRQGRNRSGRLVMTPSTPHDVASCHSLSPSTVHTNTSTPALLS